MEIIFKFSFAVQSNFLSHLTGLQQDEDSGTSSAITGVVSTLDPSSRASPGFQAQRSKVRTAPVIAANSIWYLQISTRVNV